MALEKTITTKSGIQVTNAYHRVREVKIQGVDSLHFKVKSFVSASETTPFSVSEHECLYDVNESNPFIQAYQYIKTLPEFSNAVDK